MPTERIVNSFGYGPGLQRDLDEIDEADRLAQSIVNEAVKSISKVPQGLQASNAAMKQAVDPIELETSITGVPGPNLIQKKDQDSFDLDSETDTNGVPNPFLAIKALNEIASLRASVIKTFKHMGIDTRKFFGA